MKPELGIKQGDPQGLTAPFNPLRVEPCIPARPKRQGPASMMFLAKKKYYIAQQQGTGTPQLQDPEAGLAPTSSMPCRALVTASGQQCSVAYDIHMLYLLYPCALHLRMIKALPAFLLGRH